MTPSWIPLGRVSPDDNELTAIRMKLFHLYMVSDVKADLGHFDRSRLMTSQEAGDLVKVSQDLCTDLELDALAICH